MKILYFDTETTGRDKKIHDIVQFAAIVEIDGVVKEEVNWSCQPTHWETIEQGALDATGKTIDDLKKYDLPEVMFKNIISLFDKYIEKFDKMQYKFYPAGHNVQFDLEFLDSFIKLHGNDEQKKWGITSYQNWRSLDSRVFANFLTFTGKIKTENIRLATLCDFYGIPIEAHDALSDIRATRMLVQKMMGELK